MTLLYFISAVCGVLLCALLFAFVFRRDFRRDCLAREGEVEVLKYFSVHGAVVLCLFAVFLFGLIYPLQFLPEIETNEELKVANYKLQEANKNLNNDVSELRETKNRTKKWEAKFTVLTPSGAPKGFDLSKGIGVIEPSNIIIGDKPDCFDSKCIFTFEVYTSEDRTFEDEIGYFRYLNEDYYAYVYPAQEYDEWKKGKTEKIPTLNKNTRVYAAVDLMRLGPGKSTKTPEVVGGSD